MLSTQTFDNELVCINRHPNWVDGRTNMRGHAGWTEFASTRCRTSAESLARQSPAVIVAGLKQDELIEAVA